MSMDTTSSEDLEKTAMALIQFNIWDHAKSIAIYWGITFFSACIFPVVLYVVLRYASDLSTYAILGIVTDLFGVTSLYSGCVRTYRLLKKDSNCRPLGAGPKSVRSLDVISSLLTVVQQDFFNWSFLVVSIAVTAVIIVGTCLPSVRITTLGALPLLLVMISVELLAVGMLSPFKVKAPFRISSVARGQPLRSAVYSLVEDIVAVDGGQGQAFRLQLQERYNSSIMIRRLFLEMDLIWGLSGTIVGVGTCVLVMLLPNLTAAYVLGWTIPWLYAAIMTVVTIGVCRVRLRQERNLSCAHIAS